MSARSGRDANRRSSSGSQASSQVIGELLAPPVDGDALRSPLHERQRRHAKSPQHRLRYHGRQGTSNARASPTT
jgi:hypothetical protein